MHPHAFVGEEGVADAEHECFHAANLSAVLDINNQVFRSSI
jgi:hypothetical protein